ncbi:MAG: hybrid sensor histidine kinase/response regulator [Pseudomonadota bacterium]
MTDEIKAVHASFDKDEDGELSQHSQEASQLRLKIADLLAEVESLRAATKSNDVLEGHVLQLREANQNLVLATFGAQDLQASAEAAGHRQEEFLAMLAHELRNPLAPISMAAELLGKITEVHPQLPRLHGIICRQVNQLTHLVNDLLDASRVSSGKITLQKRPMLLSELIDNAVEISQPFLDGRRQQLILDLPMEAVTIYGDPLRLAQVVSNLLINASKFTPEDQPIGLSAYLLAGAVMLSVKDTGMGIAADIQPFIFDLFRQGPHSLDRSLGGLGIGLSLVRTIVEMHGGSVEVHSAGVGAGSEFIVVLPVSAEAPPHSADRAAQKFSGRPCRILLIEDNADANDTLNEFLSLEGHTVTSTFDGVSGLAMAEENIYDVVICDIGLPGMDGYEVVKQLRLHALSPEACYIALTGYNQLENRARAIEMGFDHYLVKPIAIGALMDLIAGSVPQ